MTGIRIITDPDMPLGMGVMFGSGWLNTQSPLDFRPDPWGPAPAGFTADAAHHRRWGLDHLAGLLDGLCADLGLDPEEAWRGPRLAERLRRNLHEYVATERVTTMIVQRPEAYVVITDV